MGWLFGWKSRKELVEHLTRDYESGNGIKTKCLAKYSAGYTNLWTVWEEDYSGYTGTELYDGVPIASRPKERYICLFMLRYGRRDGWGYKDETESMGPVEVNCPLKYLEMVPHPPNDWAKAWREKVRAYHARRNLPMKVGDVVELTNSTIPEVRIVSLRPLHGEYNGRLYRVPRKMLKGVKACV